MKKFLTGAAKAAGCMLLLIVVSCSKDKDPIADATYTQPQQPFDINNINDTYPNLAPIDFSGRWGPYNTHDPSVLKTGEYYYSYSTDAAFGTAVKPGIQVRRSKDLVEWEFRGWALSGLPQQAVNYITGKKASPNQSIWAPYILKVGAEYRLYYSLASTGFRVSAIGLLTSNSPEGPWLEKGLAVTSETNGPGTNAIDPSVVVTPSGEHWMHYGSAWDGLFVVQLDPATGLAKTPGDRGKRIVRRGMTGGMYNGNLEGPEIIYNEQQQLYYLFVSYDWLETKYNVRVYRSPNPDGPFVDWNGVNVDNQADNGPMILSPYKFMGHGGWQGVSHPAVFKDNGKYYIAHQGRPGGPGNERFYMVMHVREIVWTESGWPVVSPQRYAAVPQTPAITPADLAGEYEQIVLTQPVVPGYGNEQTNPGFSEAFATKLNANGTINEGGNNTWVYNAPWLELKWNGGQFTDKLHVSRGRDWENKVASTIVMTGLNGDGTAIWLKKKQ
ncbi:arabinan endo-1,5-alpha-L-arabinosidase [Pontibacter beigongshangensis]|uniref:arabinan endo-1,5-alpha-L-arabinosidase n=1 Tax=Pontibacter beigongshangensis TaxID=2574733 RepID=UPI00164FD9D2|nr:arabinan endo-1,5-alpha-L-arabinosidase [Pontibacter beigongshangensis]